MLLSFSVTAIVLTTAFLLSPITGRLGYMVATFTFYLVIYMFLRRRVNLIKTIRKYTYLFLPLVMGASMIFSTYFIKSSYSFYDVEEITPRFNILIIVMMIIIPFFFEVLYRGYLLTRLEDKFNPYLAILLSAIAYMAQNYNNPNSMVLYYFVLGIIAAIFYYLFRNIIFNLIFIIFLDLNNYVNEFMYLKSKTFDVFIYGKVIGIILIVISAIAVFIYRKKIAEELKFIKEEHFKDFKLRHPDIVIKKILD